MIEIIVAALAVIVLFVIVYGFNLELKFKMRHIPGPNASWLIGNFKDLASKGDGQMHLVFDEWAKIYGGVFKYFLGTSPFVMVSDPALVQQICTRRFVQFHDRGSLQTANSEPKVIEFQNKSTLLASGKYWAGIRATSQPLFHREALLSYSDDMQVYVNKLLDIVAPLADKDQSICISDLLSGMTMNVIGKTAFGAEFNSQGGDLPPIVKHARTIFLPYAGMPRWVAQGSYMFPFAKQIFFKLGSILSKEKVDAVQDAFGYIWGTSFTLLQNAHNAAKSGVVLSPPLDTPSFKEAQKDFADQIPSQKSFTEALRAANNKETGEPLEEIDVSAQVFTMIVAGYETTALSLGFCFYVIARYPDIQREVQKEIDSFNGREITAADVDDMPYTTAVFLETMRRYPPVSFVFALRREAGPNAAIGDLAIPQGTCVQFNIFSMHMNPEYFPEPDKFKPARFYESDPEHDKYKPRHPYAYLPFGHGAHKCIGYKFAIQEAVLCVASFFGKYDARLDPEHHNDKEEIPVKYTKTMNPIHGVHIKASVRKQ